MIADALTKDDITKSNGALEELFRSGTLSIWDEEDQLKRRREDSRNKLRSNKASSNLRNACHVLLVESQINSLLGVYCWKLAPVCSHVLIDLTLLSRF